MIPRIKDIPGIKKVLGSPDNILWKRINIAQPAVNFRVDSVTDDAVLLKWEFSDYTYRYIVQRWLGSYFGDPKTILVIEGQTEFEYLWTGLDPNTEYTFRVISGNDETWEQTYTESVTTYTFSVPDNLQASEIGAHIELSWEWNNVYWTVAYFIVERKTEGGEWNVIAPNYSYTFYWDSNIYPSTVYIYRIIAVVDTDGELSSSSSTEIEVTTA